ncbi:MAG: O-antigen ligase family protein [Betaproteobacteria bacterium]
MNIVYAIKIFTALTILVVVARMVVGPGLKLVLSPRDWSVAWWGIVGTLAVSCFSVTPLLFFVALSIWVLLLSKRIDKDGGGRLPVYALLCCVTPPFTARLEHIGPLNDLLLLSPFRILAIFLLVPEAVRQLTLRSKGKSPPWLIVCDLAVYAFNIYWLMRIYGQGSLTSIARATIGQALDTIVPYYVITRACADGDVRRRFFGFLLLGSAYEAIVAIAESGSKHYLYSQLQWLYGVSFGQATNLVRGGWLRAVAAFPGPLALAMLLMFAIGLWFVLRPELKSRAYRTVLLCLLVGMVATFGRGPLLAALVMLASLVLLRRMSATKYLVLMIVGCVVASAAWKAGLGEWVVSLLGQVPGTDETADFNVIYRQRLLTESLALIEQSPWWGVPNYSDQLADLRQGEGIIDLVNTYLVITLNVGAVGLFMYVMPFVVSLWRGARGKPVTDTALRREGTVWLALTVGVLMAIFTVSPITIVQPIIIWTAALAIGRMLELHRAQPSPVMFGQPVSA